MILMLKIFLVFPFILYYGFNYFFAASKKSEILFGLLYFISTMLIIRVIFDNLYSFLAAFIVCFVCSIFTLIYMMANKKRYKLHRFVRIYLLMFRRIYIYMYVILMLLGIFLSYKDIF